ncbi:MAG: hypothetical protein IJU03_08140 [Thermoguttaceae bacterium]|nr:hypothetical protein [Thermoguttaceae bacterium]
MGRTLLLSREDFVARAYRVRRLRSTVEELAEKRAKFYDYLANGGEFENFPSGAKLFGIPAQTAYEWGRSLGYKTVHQKDNSYDACLRRAIKLLEKTRAPIGITDFFPKIRFWKRNQYAEFLRRLEKARPDLRALVVNKIQNKHAHKQAVLAVIQAEGLSRREIAERFGYSTKSVDMLRYQASISQREDLEFKKRALDNPVEWDNEYTREITRMKYDGFRFSEDVWSRYRKLWGEKYQYQ